MPGVVTKKQNTKCFPFITYYLFGLVPKRGPSVGDIRNGNASNLVVRLGAHEQQLVAPPGTDIIDTKTCHKNIQANRKLSPTSAVSTHIPIHIYIPIC